MLVVAVACSGGEMEGASSESSDEGPLSEDEVAALSRERMLRVTAIEIQRYVAAKEGGASEKLVCHAAGAAQASFLVLDFANLTPDEIASELEMTHLEAIGVRDQVAADSDTCTEL